MKTRESGSGPSTRVRLARAVGNGLITRSEAQIILARQTVAPRPSAPCPCAASKTTPTGSAPPPTPAPPSGEAAATLTAAGADTADRCRPVLVETPAGEACLAATRALPAAPA
jgi:hypothetical protein